MLFVHLETDRLLLKGLTPEAMTHLFENYPKTEIKMLLGHRSEEDYQLEEYKQKNGYAAYNRSFLLFLLTEKRSQKIIGRCGIHNWNKDHFRAEIGYSIQDEDDKKKGFMTEALPPIIAYGFNDLKLHRLEALVGAGNEASLRLLKKNRFVEEGLLREHYKTAQGYVDSICFSLLEREYRHR